ncbi:MAG: hydrogenase maturation protease [Chloroflexi bacterium]|nr:hydrogenase maturation protease [Chloroflexota bacterium]
MTCLIVGYGSLVRGDDGLGQIIAEALRERMPEADVMAVTQLAPEIAEPLSRAAAAFFIDALDVADLGQTPGELHIRAVTPDAGEGAFSHNVTPERLLTAAAMLYGGAPPTHLITVVAQTFDIADTLSPALQAALPGLIKTIEGFIREHSG